MMSISSFSICILTLECWGDFWHKDLVEHFCGRYCPEVQLLLKAQTGFDVSFLVCWMGTVGREKEPSILHQTAWPSTPLALHQNNQALACQPGWEWKGKLGMWLVSDAFERSEFQRAEMPENLGKNVKQQRKKEKCCSFCGKRGFSLLPNSTSAGNPIQHAAGIRKIWKMNHHIKKTSKNKNNSAVSTLITSTSFVVPFLMRIRPVCF